MLVRKYILWFKVIPRFRRKRVFHNLFLFQARIIKIIFVVSLLTEVSFSNYHHWGLYALSNACSWINLAYLSDYSTSSVRSSNTYLSFQTKHDCLSSEIGSILQPPICWN